MFWPTFVLMIVGAALWLTGELWGVKRRGKKMDTTSEAVWWLQKRPWVGPIIRVLVVVFVLSLAGHFFYGWSLLP
jgi:hypothetical protein